LNRQAAPAAIQPFLNAWPIPNGPDLGNGFAQFSATYSNPTTLDAHSIRVDHSINSKLFLFVRYNYAPSETVTRGGSVPLSDITSAQVSTQTVTVGVTQSVSPRISNEARFNYSTVKANAGYTLDAFGGATPVDRYLRNRTGR
jgi:hypothetical protein